MTQKRDNYAITAENARRLFLKEDQAKLIQKFNLKADDAYLYLRFLDMTCLIDRKCGHIRMKVDGADYMDDNSYHTVLSVYDYLCGSKDDRQLAGKWVSMVSLGYSFHTGLLEGEFSIYAQSAKAFSGHIEGLDSVCRRLGGHKMTVGDVGYILPVFDELPVYFQFWEGDDEFPVKIVFLWDANTTQYIQYETTYSVADMVLRRMKELLPGP